jgi:type I restriction enzyme S subunit
MADWRDCKLGDLLQIKHGFAFLGEHFGSTGTHVVLTPGNFLEEGGFKEKRDKAKWYSGPIPDDYVLNEGDLIVAMTEQAEGLLGSSALILRSGVYLHNQRLGLVQIRDRKQADQHFIYYLFNSKPVRQQIRGSASGTKIRHTAPSRIADVKVRLPSLPVQRRIAGILSAYDELMENSQRRVRLLESMARALYREWFVHFRFPGHEKLPRVASPLGDIPQGWEVKPLESLMVDHIGGGWGKEVADEEHTEPAWVIRGTDIPNARSSRVADVPYRFHTVSNLRTRRLQAGDILFEVSGGSKGQPVGRALLVTAQLLSALGDESVICASFCKRVRPDAAGYGSELLYLSFVEGYESGEIEQFQVQSTGISNFKWTEYIAKTERVIPPAPLRVRFRERVAPLFSQTATLGLQIQNLRRTRDLLLPRLLSGQVELKAEAA